METIKFKLLHPDAKLPTRAHDTDACFDVVAVSVSELDAGFIEYGLGFATEMPPGWVGYVYPRSSVSETCLILCNSPGIIDADYRGQWRARFKVMPYTFGDNNKAGVMADFLNEPRIYAIGDRVAQIQFRKLDTYALTLADDLNDTPRGTGGYGSTGA